MLLSSDVIDFKANSDALFTPTQLDWLNKQVIPRRLFLKSATEFDDNWVDTSTGRWEFRFSGKNLVIDFDKGHNFMLCSELTIKLIKLATISYLSDNSGYHSPVFASHVAKSLMDMDSLSHDSFISQLRKLSTDPKLHREFYSLLHALRKLDIKGFFKDIDGESDLEDKLLFVPRPAINNWGIYSEIDNILPPEVVSMVENGLHLWASRLTPRLRTKEEKQHHLAKMKKRVDINKLRDCIILGLSYAVGPRPIQISKIAVGNIYIDTEISELTRFAIAIPYSKKTTVHVDRVRVALPEELGKLVFLYQNLANLNVGDPLFPQDENAAVMVNEAIKRQLLRFSPKSMQQAVKAGEAEAPLYTASLFRHHMGHSMAMSGASAEEIAYIMGHTSTVVANRYISVTPSLADIREKALGSNPVFKNMIALMMTGNLVHSKDWTGRKVAGCVGGKLHYHVGGCNYKENICPFAQVRGCYGCLYFKPFIDGHHQQIFDAFNDEIIHLIKLSDDTGETRHSLIPELTRRKNHTNAVMIRIEMFNQAEEAF